MSSWEHLIGWAVTASPRSIRRAQDLVDRQRADRRNELERLARNLQRLGRLRAGMTMRHALNLLVFTSYETFREFREAELCDRQATALMQETARELLVTPQA